MALNRRIHVPSVAAVSLLVAAAALMASLVGSSAAQPSASDAETVGDAAEQDAEARARYLRRLRHKPVVSGFARSGDKLVVAGENFAADTTIAVDGTPIKATTTASRIVGELGHRVGEVVVTTAGETHHVGTLAIENPSRVSPASQRRRDLAAARERIAAKRLDNPPLQDRARAHRRWVEERQRSRSRRARATEDALRGDYDQSFLADWQTQRELALHMERRARLVWILELAQKRDAEELLVRADAALNTEMTRHLARLRILRDVARLESKATK